jgi:hypothetical protein
MRAQREFELKDGAKRRRLRRLPKAILDFKFSLRLRLSMRFKGESAFAGVSIGGPLWALPKVTPFRYNKPGPI